MLILIAIYKLPHFVFPRHRLFLKRCDDNVFFLEGLSHRNSTSPWECYSRKEARQSINQLKHEMVKHFTVLLHFQFFVWCSSPALQIFPSFEPGFLVILFGRFFWEISEFEARNRSRAESFFVSTELTLKSMFCALEVAFLRSRVEKDFSPCWMWRQRQPTLINSTTLSVRELSMRGYVCHVQANATLPHYPHARSMAGVGVEREISAGIGIYFGQQKPASVSLPVQYDVKRGPGPTWDAPSYAKTQEKTIMLGILIGTRRAPPGTESVLVLSDCKAAVEKLQEKFAALKVQIGLVSRKGVIPARRLARKACSTRVVSLFGTVPHLSP